MKEIFSMNEINPDSSNVNDSILALQKANNELSNKIDEIYDIALSSTKKVRIGSGIGICIALQ
jgi:hypothetical protein